MFPRENTPQIAPPRRFETRGWEAMDQVSARQADAPAVPPAAAPSWRERAGRALGLARAFLLLEETAPSAPSTPASAHVPAGAPAHPHRQPLRPKLRSRRPGAAAPRHQHCLTPLSRPSSQPRSARVPGWQPR